jgi:hypothetical protein
VTDLDLDPDFDPPPRRPPPPKLGSSRAFAYLALALSLAPWLGCVGWIATLAYGIAGQIDGAPPLDRGAPPPPWVLGLIATQGLFMVGAMIALPFVVLARTDGEARTTVIAARIFGLSAAGLLVLMCGLGVVGAVVGLSGMAGLAR